MSNCHLTQALILGAGFNKQKEQFVYLPNTQCHLMPPWWHPSVSSAGEICSLMLFHPLTRGKHGMRRISLNLRVMEGHTGSLHLPYLRHLCSLDLSIWLLSASECLKIKNHEVEGRATKVAQHWGSFSHTVQLLLLPAGFSDLNKRGQDDLPMYLGSLVLSKTKWLYKSICNSGKYDQRNYMIRQHVLLKVVELHAYELLQLVKYHCRYSDLKVCFSTIASKNSIQVCSLWEIWSQQDLVNCHKPGQTVFQEQFLPWKHISLLYE